MATADRDGQAAGAVRASVDIDQLELERLAVGTWVPEELVEVDGWWHRASGGFTGRGNSALCLTTVEGDLDDRLDGVLAWYRERGLPPWLAVALPVLTDLHDRVVARGWTVHHGGRVLVRPLASPGRSDRRPGRTRVAIEPSPDDDWLSRYRDRGGELPDVGRRMLTRGDHVGFATVCDVDEVVAIGRGVVVDGWLGINAVETAPSHRRRGLATDVLAALVAWAGEHGARSVFLQVDLANDAARALYERAGFVQHHTYHYLQAPG